MEIWLICDGEDLRLPFVEIGQGVGISAPFNNGTANLYEVGDILVTGNDGLKTFSYSSHFPDQQYGYLDVADPMEPYQYVEIIDRFRRSKEPTRLIITRTPVNLLMRIDSFTYDEREFTGSVYYTLEMTEYKLIDEPKEANAGEHDPAERRPRTAEDEEIAEGFAAPRDTYDIELEGSSRDEERQRMLDEAVVYETWVDGLGPNEAQWRR